jgi:phthalate 4,5-dioxygenase
MPAMCTIPSAVYATTVFETPDADGSASTYKATWDDNFFQDQAGMNASWTGFPASRPRTRRCRCHAHPYFDRTRENLVPADQGVIRLRRRLADCV